MTQYYLAREIERVRATHQQMEIVLPALPADGDLPALKQATVVVPPAQLWSDDITVSAQINPPAAAAELLGADNYEHWKRAGGTAGVFFEIARRHAGAASSGESSES